MESGGLRLGLGSLGPMEGTDHVAPDHKPRRVISLLPPGASVVLGEHELGSRSSVPLWLAWLRIARIQARVAHEARESDESLDWASAAIAQLDPPQPRPDPPPEWNEMFASLVAIGAAAYAIDGFYGSVRPLVSPPAATAKRPSRWRRAIGVLLRSESRRSRPKRSRQIVETLKLGFNIGGEWQRWLTDIDRLFDLRDDAVHHEEAFRPMVVYRVTDETLAAAAPELYDYSAERADWAVALAVEVLATCAERPKPATAAWIASREKLAKAIRGAG
jgi:hypothetical protein